MIGQVVLLRRWSVWPIVSLTLPWGLPDTVLSCAALVNPVPLKVMNDGEVTAVAGVQMMEQQEKGKTIGKGTFGISMGSNCGAGYMYPTNKDGMPVHPGWLNELWTVRTVFHRSEAALAGRRLSSVSVLLTSLAL